LLWIRFNLLCDGQTQHRIQKTCRKNIINWERVGLVKGAVLTYHWVEPPDPADSLYVCLNVPSVDKPPTRSIQLEKYLLK
jgi:hypothetical protein